MTIIEDWDTDRILHIRYLEGMSSTEYFESILGLSSDPRFDQLKMLISDWSGLSSLTSQVATEDVEKAMAFTKAIS